MLGQEPDYEAVFGIIKHLSTDELKELMNNEEKLSNLVKDLPQVKNLASEKEVLLISNKSLAEFNLTFDSKLTDGRNDLIAKYDESSSLQEQVATMKSQLDSSSSASKHSADTIQALLQTSAQELEEESEDLVKTFLDNEQNIEEFLSEFVSQRTKGHERRIKADKLAEMVKSGRVISDLHSSGGVGSTSYPTGGISNTPYPTGGVYPAPSASSNWSAPYPSQMPSMPMPNF